MKFDFALKVLLSITVLLCLGVLYNSRQCIDDEQLSSQIKVAQQYRDLLEDVLALMENSTVNKPIPALKPVPTVIQPKVTAERAHGSNLVLGLMIDPDIHFVMNFMASFRKYNKLDDVYLFIKKPVSEHIKSISSAFDIFLIEYAVEDLSRSISSLSDSHYKWAIYDKFLLKYASHYDKILIVNPHEVCFQFNPFAYQLNDETIYMNADLNTPVNKDQTINKHVSSCIASDMVNTIRSLPRIDVEMYLAKSKPLTQFVTLLSAIVTSNTVNNQCPSQLYQLSVLSSSLNNMHVLIEDSDSSPLFSSVTSSSSQPIKAAVIGKYYRNYDLLLDVIQLYSSSSSVLPLDVNHNHQIKDDPCANYIVLNGFDYLKGKCDLSVVSASPSCCQACQSKSSTCMGWAQSGDLCYLKSCTPDSLDDPGGVATVDLLFGMRID